jgi:hypothetical protein
LQNTYSNFLSNQRGGVYQLDGVTFYEELSTYKNNSAVLGGAISCTRCKMNTLSNLFEMNIANEGGVFYIESDSISTNKYDKFQKNTALLTGGVMFVITRSFFIIFSSKFI